MNAKLALRGRRIHVAGSIDADPSVAPAEEVKLARDFVQGFVRRALEMGASFVLPVDAEKFRPIDQMPICFDWLIWETIYGELANIPVNPSVPLVHAVKHHKNEEQIPPQFHKLWNEIRDSNRIFIESAAHWNMGSKRFEIQARLGDVLVVLGGGEGVHFLANLYHDAGKPVIPLNFKITREGSGARKIYQLASLPGKANRTFAVVGDVNSQTWLLQLDFTFRDSAQRRVDKVCALLGALAPPRAFAVRLLNPKHPDFSDVENYFQTIVKPVVEDELGLHLTVIDEEHKYENPRIDQEIFEKLHRSSLVIADITGERPNCFMELGYALGRNLPVVVSVREGGASPFDLQTFAGHRWKTTGTVSERKEALLRHINSVKSRPPLVPTDSLIP